MTGDDVEVTTGAVEVQPAGRVITSAAEVTTSAVEVTLSAKNRFGLCACACVRAGTGTARNPVITLKPPAPQHLWGMDEVFERAASAPLNGRLARGVSHEF